MAAVAGPVQAFPAVPALRGQHQREQARPDLAAGRPPGPAVLYFDPEQISQSSSQARRFASRTLRLLDARPDLVVDTQSVVSELVLEAMARRRRPSTLTIVSGPTRVRVELVAEGRCPPLPEPSDRAVSRELVAQLTVTHGSRPIRDGRRWWAVLARHAG
jgi:hypothetical protein